MATSRPTHASFSPQARANKAALTCNAEGMFLLLCALCLFGFTHAQLFQRQQSLHKQNTPLLPRQLAFWGQSPPSKRIRRLQTGTLRQFGLRLLACKTSSKWKYFGPDSLYSNTRPRSTAKGLKCKWASDLSQLPLISVGSRFHPSSLTSVRTGSCGFKMFLCSHGNPNKTGLG